MKLQVLELSNEMPRDQSIYLFVPSTNDSNLQCFIVSTVLIVNRPFTRTLVFYKHQPDGELEKFTPPKGFWAKIMFSIPDGGYK